MQPATDASASATRPAAPKSAPPKSSANDSVRNASPGSRRLFVDGPLLFIRGGGSGMSNSTGATVIPDVGTVFFGPYRHNADAGMLEAEKGVLLETNGTVRRVPAPVRRDDTTAVGDGWTFMAKPGWVIREGSRPGDYEVVRQQP